ncbi:polyprenyl synthetase family protein [Streptomyces sp. NPDC058374]|uniref:polyprenyl synthetase family protein n=1 Tax=unclassified Streptomyces TaxID=2593676 RepID=UPI0036600C37
MARTQDPRAARAPAHPDAGPGPRPGEPGTGQAALCPEAPGADAADGRPGRPAPATPHPEVAAVDADIGRAVGAQLGELLAERLQEARATDPVSGRDIAERIARFTALGGRRMRPALLWWALRACALPDHGRARAALRVGAAVELLQTCALVHDDVMDSSRLRRGRPALHVSLATQYGARSTDVFAGAAAVLAGDLALAWAEDTLAETELPDPVRRRVRTVWRVMRGEMVAGQYLDLHGQVTADRSALLALRTARLKSAQYSAARPLELGAVLAGADPLLTRRLAGAGAPAGLAFQLRDDLLGVYGDPSRTGKPAGDDIREGKPTLLVALAHARATARGRLADVAVLESALGDPRLTPAGLDAVREVLEATGARAAVEERIDRLAARALARLDSLALDPVAGDRLRGLLRLAAGTHPDAAPPHPDREAGHADTARPH